MYFHSSELDMWPVCMADRCLARASHRRKKKKRSEPREIREPQVESAFQPL